MHSDELDQTSLSWILVGLDTQHLLSPAIRGAPRLIQAIEDHDGRPSQAPEEHRLLQGRAAAMHPVAARASAYQVILEERSARSQV